MFPNKFAILASILGDAAVVTLTNTIVAGTTYSIYCKTGFLAVVLYPYYTNEGVIIINSMNKLTIFGGDDFENKFEVTSDNATVNIKALIDFPYPIQYKELW